MKSAHTQSLEQHIQLFSLLRFTAPTMLMMLAMGLYTITDTIFIARLVNTNALSAVNIVCPVINGIVGLGTMLAAGGNAVIAPILIPIMASLGAVLFRNFCWHWTPPSRILLVRTAALLLRCQPIVISRLPRLFKRAAALYASQHAANFLSEFFCHRRPPRLRHGLVAACRHLQYFAGLSVYGVLFHGDSRRCFGHRYQLLYSRPFWLALFS